MKKTFILSLLILSFPTVTFSPRLFGTFGGGTIGAVLGYLEYLREKQNLEKDKKEDEAREAIKALPAWYVYVLTGGAVGAAGGNVLGSYWKSKAGIPKKEPQKRFNTSPASRVAETSNKVTEAEFTTPTKSTFVLDFGNNECPVCLGTNKDETAIQLGGCGHLIGAACLNQLISNKKTNACPLCRKKLPNDLVNLGFTFSTSTHSFHDNAPPRPRLQPRPSFFMLQPPSNNYSHRNANTGLSRLLQNWSSSDEDDDEFERMLHVLGFDSRLPVRP